tara:strand:- start:277 stop:1110 length:834 start_codon:yes stop_codon:yes gene_type:complete
MTTYEEDLAAAMAASLNIADLNRPLQERRAEGFRDPIRRVANDYSAPPSETSSDSEEEDEPPIRLFADARAADQAQNARGQAQESVRLTTGQWGDEIPTLAEAKVATLQAEHAIFTFEEWRQYGFKHGLMRKLFEWAAENAPEMEEARTRPPPPPPPTLNLKETGVLFDVVEVGHDPSGKRWVKRHVVAGEGTKWNNLHYDVLRNLRRTTQLNRYSTDFLLDGGEVVALLVNAKVAGITKLKAGLRKRVKVNGVYERVPIAEQLVGRRACVAALLKV